MFQAELGRAMKLCQSYATNLPARSKKSCEIMPKLYKNVSS